MSFVVTQLTRMRDGHVCVAGVDTVTDKHVRPVLPGHGRFAVTSLARNGGAFDLGAIVDLGRTRPRPEQPETEDVVLMGQPTRQGELSAKEFWALLDGVAEGTLEAIFGPALEKKGARACGTACGRGQASLGVLRPAGPVRIQMLEFEEGTKIKATVAFGAEWISVPVTDVRLFEADCITPSRARFERVSAMLSSGSSVLLAVGLARAWPLNDPTAVHWLQVNGVFVNDGALWRDQDDRD